MQNKDPKRNDHDAHKKKNPPKMIAAQDCINTALRDLLKNQPLSSGKVSFAWSVAVGSTMNRVTSAGLQPDGTLTVRADNPHWTREVRRSRALIMSRINRLLGPDVVRDMKVFDDSSGEPSNRA